MDPALFRIDWDVLAELLVTVIVLAFFIERALAVVFEYRPFVVRFEKKGIKEPIALIVSLAVVAWLQFDALAILFRLDAPTIWGYVITAAIIAGGSKASIALFQNVMNAKSTAARTAQEAGVSGVTTTRTQRKKKKKT